MAGWFVADADGYGVRFVGGEDEPELEPGETADYYGVGLDEQEVRASLRRSVAGQQIGIGDGETTQFEVPGAPVAHGTLTLYLDGDPVDPEDYLWNPEGGSIVFEDEDYDPDEPDPSKRRPPAPGAVLTADYICLGRRPWAFLSLDKDEIDADGIDGATLTVTVQDPDEIGVPAKVALDVMGEEVEVELDNGEGEVSITADLPGVIEISCPDKHVNPIPNRLEVRAVG